MGKTILHTDMNGFYASIETMGKPELQLKPVAVGGDPDKRHGIVLAKNEVAKIYGVKTGMTLWQARQRCPELVVMKANPKKYLQVSQAAREIYGRYTDVVEPFGLDEAWLDVGGSRLLFGDGRHIADELRARIRHELGITASVGVSFNKIFAKLGSDMKKPDATTVINEQNYKQLVWRLPVKDLLFVGAATNQKLKRHHIETIGDLAQTHPSVLRGWLGVNGVVLHSFANGLESDEIFNDTFGDAGEAGMKSIGNSTTTPRDLVTEQEASMTLWVLSESVAARLRKHRFLCKTVQLWMRDTRMEGLERQCKLTCPSQLAREIFDAVLALYRAHKPVDPLRSVGVRACDLMPDTSARQLSMFEEEQKRQAHMQIEHAMDGIRERYGHFSIMRGCMMLDKQLTDLNPKDDHQNPCIRSNDDVEMLA